MKGPSKLQILIQGGRDQVTETEDEFEIHIPEPVKPMPMHPQLKECKTNDTICYHDHAEQQARWDQEDMELMASYELEYILWKQEVKRLEQTRRKSKVKKLIVEPKTINVTNNEVMEAFDAFPTVEALKDGVGKDAWNLFIKLLMERGSFQK